MFHHQWKGSLTAQGKPLKDLTRIITTHVFLSEDKRLALLKKINDLSSLESSRYESLCTALIDNLVHYCQNLPETANSYYSQPGGLVDHALNRTEAALSLFQEFMIHDPSSPLSEEQMLWQYALYSASLLQGIGKLFVDYKVHFYDLNVQFLKEWNPLLESMTSTGIYYSYEFQKEPERAFRRRLNVLMARTLMPANGFAWIASHPEVLAVWLALLNEDERSAGTLGALLIRADALAIQAYLFEFMARDTMSSPGNRYRTGTFSGVEPETLLEKEQALGITFVQWMIQSLDKGHVMINKAPLFMVPGGMLMCQEIFQLFVRENPEYKNWQAIQNGFLALGLHNFAADKSAFFRYEQTQNQQMLSGILFSKYAVALPASVTVHQINTGKLESVSAVELVHRAQYSSQFTQQQNSTQISPLQKLNASGQWQDLENENNTPRAGVKGSA